MSLALACIPLPQAAQAPPLRQLLKSQPEHLEARVKLLHPLRMEAEAGTRSMEGTQDLEPAEDVRLWGPWAQEFDRVVSTAGWQADGLPLLNGAEQPLERRSALVRTLFQRRLPDVQEALRQWPDHRDTWALWLWMHRILGRTPQPPSPSHLPATAETRSWLAQRIPGLAFSAPPPLPEACPLALLILENEDPSCWKAPLLALTDSPSLAAWNLPVREIPPGAPLRKPLGVPAAERCWLLVDAGLNVLAKGVRCPDQEALERALATSGYRPQGERLAEEATTLARQEALLETLAETATRRTRALLELPPGSLQGEHPPLNDRELTEDDDPWQTYAQALLRFLEAPGWPGGHPDRSLDPLCPPGREASPTLRRLAPDILRRAAARLQLHPTSDRAWRLWLAYAPLVEGASLTHLLRSLTPAPGTSPWPPPRAARALMDEAARHQEVRDGG